MDEQSIINSAYIILEQDSEYWDTDSVEYLTARGLLKLAVQRWENLEGTLWRTLGKKYSQSTTIASNAFTLPADFTRLLSYVRTVDSNNASVFWQPIPLSEVQAYANDSSKYYCYVTGSKAAGFTLTFNPLMTVTTPQTVSFEYYKQASTTAATTDEVEMDNPAFAAHFIAAYMSDGGLNSNFFQIAEQMLEEMKSNDDLTIPLVPNEIPHQLTTDHGFGY